MIWPRVRARQHQLSQHSWNRHENNQQLTFRSSNSGSRSWYLNFNVRECRSYMLLVIQGVQYHVVLRATHIQGKNI